MTNVTTDLNSLRIDSSLKATPDAGGRRRRWPWAAAAAAMILVALLGYRGTTSAVDVRVARAAPPAPRAGGAGEVVLDAVGYIVAAHKIELAPKVVGRVKWVGVEMGDRVRQGQELVRLEDDEYRARLAQQQGQVDAAKARLAEFEAGSRPEEIDKSAADLESADADQENARQSVERNRKLVGTNAVSQQALDDAEAKLRSSSARVASARASHALVRAGPRKEQIAAQRATVSQAQGELDLARLDVENAVIRAPIDGTILARNVEVGEYVTTGFVGDNGAKGFVVSTADLSELRVELDVSQNDFPKVALGQHCTVTTDAYPDRRYEGAVDQIAPEANRQKATVQVKVKVLNPDPLLRPDMNASVAFEGAGETAAPSTRTAATAATTGPVSTAPPGVAVPASAVRDGRVFVVENGRAVERVVDVGRTIGGRAYVTKGLAGGELVVVGPPESLVDGRKVRVQE